MHQAGMMVVAARDPSDYLVEVKQSSLFFLYTALISIRERELGQHTPDLLGQRKRPVWSQTQRIYAHAAEFDRRCLAVALVTPFCFRHQ
jgi:hypothetical protein